MLSLVTLPQKLALSAAVLIAAVLGFSAWLKVRDIRVAHDAIVHRDAIWSQKLTEQRQHAEAEREALQAKVNETAAVERAKAVVDVLAATSRTQALETELAALKDDPVVFPRSIARELRR